MPVSKVAVLADVYGSSTDGFSSTGARLIVGMIALPAPAVPAKIFLPVKTFSYFFLAGLSLEAVASAGVTISSTPYRFL